MSLAFDEYGRPFIVLKEQDTKQRIKGIDAIKVLPAPRRETSSPHAQSQPLSAPPSDPRDSTSCSSRPTRKSPSPTTAPPSSRRWKSSTQLRACSSSSPRVRTMKSEMAPQASSYWLARSSNKQRNCSIRVQIASFRSASSQDFRWLRPRCGHCSQATRRTQSRDQVRQDRVQ